MDDMTAFGIGIAIGIVLGMLGAFVFVMALAYRDGHPFGDTPREETPP